MNTYEAAYELGRKRQLLEVLSFIKAILDDDEQKNKLDNLPATRVLAVLGKTLAEQVDKEE